MSVQLAPGAVFAGDFEIVSHLAEGGMGVLYVAVQRSTGKRRALKLIRPELVADPKIRARFAQEARVASKVESEHVVEFVGAGIDAQTGAAWIAMEHLEGEDLAHYVARRGALPVAEASPILAQICHAIGAAHAASIVHRDLKPENVFIARSRREGASLVVKVLDFGIAKAIEEARATANATAAIGTPMWMAPEQSDVRSIIGPSTDVWALGLIVFWMLTGQPFWLNVREGGTLMTLMREMLVEPIPTASERARALGVAHLLPQGFDDWFASAVVRDPKMRFANANELRAAFDAMIARASQTPSIPSAAPPPPPPPPRAPMVATQQMPPPQAPAVASMGASFPAVAVTSARPTKLPVAAIAGGAGAFALLVIGLVTWKLWPEHAHYDRPAGAVLYDRVELPDDLEPAGEGGATLVDGAIYFVARDDDGNRQIEEVSVAGKEVRKLAPASFRTEGISTDGKRLYWVDDDHLKSVGFDGGSVVDGPEVGANQVGVDDKYFYDVDYSGAIKRLAKGTPDAKWETVAKMASEDRKTYQALAADVQYLWVLSTEGSTGHGSDATVILRMKKPTCVIEDSSGYLAPGEATTAAAKCPEVETKRWEADAAEPALSIDDGVVYWVGHDDFETLRAMKLEGGGAPTSIGILPASVHASLLADGKTLYWCGMDAIGKATP